MSGFTQTTSGSGNFITVDSERKQIAIGQNNYITDNYLNDTGGDFTLDIGLVMARISATGILAPFVATAADGTQFPVGFVTEVITVADTITISLLLVNDGEIDLGLITLTGGDTLDTIVTNAGGRRVRDLLVSSMKGVRLTTTQDLTNFANS